MIIKFAPVPFVSSNIDDDELVRLVEHNYPNLQGPLHVMLERFAGMATVKWCPHCGSEFMLEDFS